MSGGFFGELLGMGALYMRHVAAARMALALPPEQMQAQLHQYLGSLTPPQFAGFKISVELDANGEADANVQQALKWVAANAEALRDQTPGADAGTAPSAAPEDGGEPTFDETMQAVNHWYGSLAADQGASARSELDDYVGRATDSEFRNFVAHLDTILVNIAGNAERTKANENSAWGGSVEDRIAYGMARLRTGQRDPGIARQLEEYAQQTAFVTEVRRVATERRAQAEAEKSRAAAEAAASAARAPVAMPDNAAAGVLRRDAASSAASSADPDAEARIAQVEAQLGMLEAEREKALANGTLRPERDFAMRAVLDRLRGTLRDHAAGRISPEEVQASVRALAASRSEMLVDSGPDFVSALPEGSRALALVPQVQAMKKRLSAVLMNPAGERTHESGTRLYTQVCAAYRELAKLADDGRAAEFERTDLRPLAQEAHELALLENLTVASPYWRCGDVDPAPSRVLVSGAGDLAELVAAAAGPRRLDVASPAPARSYGQARWDEIRGAFVSVFDWRAHEKDLAARDRPAAEALSAVAYELGLALALGKPVLIVVAADGNLPFDVDIDPVELTGDAAEDVEALGAALDHAVYGRQRESGESSTLEETLARIGALADAAGKRRVFEGMGWLDPALVRDPAAFAAKARQALKQVPGHRLITPVWPSSAPAEEPTLFHVRPFSRPWSKDVRAAVSRACGTAGVAYTDGATAKDSRILHRIWKGLGAAHHVVADVTELNPNVLIEIGMAHALGRPTLIVERRVESAPPPAIRNLAKVEISPYEDMAALERLVAEWVAREE